MQKVFSVQRRLLLLKPEVPQTLYYCFLFLAGAKELLHVRESWSACTANPSQAVPTVKRVWLKPMCRQSSSWLIQLPLKPLAGSKWLNFKLIKAWHKKIHRILVDTLNLLSLGSCPPLMSLESRNWGQKVSAVYYLFICSSFFV